MNDRHFTYRYTSFVSIVILCIAGFHVFNCEASDTFRYVVKDNPGASHPFLSWTEAAATIQDAINACDPGDTVVVSNGVYDVGGTVVVSNGTYDAGGTVAPQTNRVYISKAITVRSAANDPSTTLIKGALDPSTSQGYGPAAVRCVYIVDGASLIGFTVTNGSTFPSAAKPVSLYQGGGIYCAGTGMALISNCVITGSSAIRGAVWAGVLRHCILRENGVAKNIAGIARGTAVNSILYDCTLTRNYAWNSGGADSCTLYRCDINGNNAGTDGGGASWSTLYDCVVTNNFSPEGGGVMRCTVSNSVLSGNSARTGGGAKASTLFNCLVLSNAAIYAGVGYGGGGVYSSTLYGCLLAGNTATLSWGGGGAYGGTLYNCTIVSNSTGGVGGGVYGSTNWNCISWGNNVEDDFSVSGGASYSCGLNYTNDGVYIGNIDVDPQFKRAVDWNFRLSGNSPCINQGTSQSWMTEAWDLDGVRRIRDNAVDMGAYEFVVERTLLQLR